MAAQAIYDPRRNSYVVSQSARGDEAGEIEYRFILIAPTEEEPRYTGCIAKSWFDETDGPLQQAFPIGFYVYEESFEEEFRSIIEQAREQAVSNDLDEFECVVEYIKQNILDSGWDTPVWLEAWDIWWYYSSVDLEKILFEIDGLWTAGPVDAYTARRRSEM